MKRGAVAAVAILAIGVVAGVLMASVSNSEEGPGGATSTGGPQGGSEVNLDLSGTGPNCIGGLCLEKLPETIQYEEVGAYLVALRNGLASDQRPETANVCHVVAHEIGRRAIKSGESVVRLLDLDDGGCLYGYQHGVLEGWSLQSGLEVLVAGIPGACAAYDDGGTLGGLGVNEVAYARGSCAHGIGHAISLQNIGSVAEAVAYCAGVGEGQIGGCAGGVFMAYSSENPSQGGSSEALSLEKGEVEGLCLQLTGEFAEECWSKLWLLGSRVGIPATEIAKLCPTDGAEKCGRGVGEGLYYENSLEAVAAIGKCPENVKTQCIYGVAWAEANVWAGSGNTRENYTSVCTTNLNVDLTECRRNEEEALKGAVG